MKQAVLIESDWNLTPEQITGIKVHETVLIESDWNLKL